MAFLDIIIDMKVRVFDAPQKPEDDLLHSCSRKERVTEWLLYAGSKQTNLPGPPAVLQRPYAQSGRPDASLQSSPAFTNARSQYARKLAEHHLPHSLASSIQNDPGKLQRQQQSPLMGSETQLRIEAMPRPYEATRSKRLGYGNPKVGSGDLSGGSRLDVPAANSVQRPNKHEISVISRDSNPDRQQSSLMPFSMSARFYEARPATQLNLWHSGQHQGQTLDPTQGL